MQNMRKLTANSDFDSMQRQVSMEIRDLLFITDFPSHLTGRYNKQNKPVLRKALHEAEFSLEATKPVIPKL